MPDITITTQGVLNLLRVIDEKKAVGPDDLSPRVLKELAEILADPITTIYQKSLEQERIPKDWLSARVVPTYKKKGERYDCENYRPISITLYIMRNYGTHRFQPHKETLTHKQYPISITTWFSKQEIL